MRAASFPAPFQTGKRTHGLWALQSLATKLSSKLHLCSLEVITFSWKDLTLWLLIAMAALLLPMAAGWRLGGATASRSWELSAFPSLEAAAEAPGLPEGRMGRAAPQCREEVSHPQEKAHRGRGQRARKKGWVQIVCVGCLASLREKPDRTENATPYRIRHLCNISAAGPAKVQGVAGLHRARKVSLDLPGKWVGAEPWERSPALRAKQTHRLA